ncbi:hypothetical protein D3C87_2110900 [compost metagenome]
MAVFESEAILRRDTEPTCSRQEGGRVRLAMIVVAIGNDRREAVAQSVPVEIALDVVML